VAGQAAGRRLEAGDVIGARHDDTPRAAAARGLQHVEGAVQVRPGERGQVGLAGNAAEVHDRVDTLRRTQDGTGVAQVGGRDGLRRVLGDERLDVAQAKLAQPAATQAGAQRRSDPTGGTGQ
jgi:hypothetical protein